MSAYLFLPLASAIASALASHLESARKTCEFGTLSLVCDMCTGGIGSSETCWTEHHWGK